MQHEMTTTTKPPLILFGSQTGNAQDVAEFMQREISHKLGLATPRISSADAYLSSPLFPTFPQEQVVIFVISTTGQGDPPENFTQFWKFLRRKSLPPDSLAGMVAVFGLGDSGYLKYNIMSKLLYRRLNALGASFLLPLGQGDDQHPNGYDAALDLWFPELLRALVQRCYTSNSIAIDTTTPAPLPVKYAITKMESGAATVRGGKEKYFYEECIAAAVAIDTVQEQQTSYPPTHFTTISANTRVTAADHFQDVRKIEFKLLPEGGGDTETEYNIPTPNPGDVVSIWPQQSLHAINEFFTSIFTSFTGEEMVEINNNNNTRCQIRLKALIGGMIDIDSAVPRRSFFLALLQHATNAMTKTEVSDNAYVERLRYFCTTPAGRDDLYDYCRKEGRTVLEILKDFSPALVFNAPLLDLILSYAPRLRPRKFSVASYDVPRGNSSISGSTSCAVQLLVAVVEWTTAAGRRRRRGLCSSWLAASPPGTKIGVWVEKGALKLPPTHVPCICIGPGTGIAPFLSAVQQRCVAAAAADDVSQPKNVLLFFGCRYKEKDYYVKNLLEDAYAKGVLVVDPGLTTAFSRDSTIPSNTKVYVQDKIREYKDLVWEFIENKGAAVFVAGSAGKMPREVAAAVMAVVAEKMGGSEEEARKYVKRMETTGRYQVECWS